MIRFIKIIFVITGISCFCIFPEPALAKNRVLTNVMVIHASTGSERIDPNLNKIISELKSVFKYTSYRLLKDQQLNLGFDERGQVALPGKRTLVVIPANIKRKRIQYQINIQKNKRSVFQTQILLKNNSSITIGGPQFKNGVLLLNISGSMQ